MRLERLLPLLGALLLGACAPRFYERQALTLDHRELDRFEIRYADFDGCLLKRPVPVDYHLKRPQYDLRLGTRFGDDRGAAAIEVEVSSEEDLTLRFPDLSAAPAPNRVDRVLHYRIDAGLIRNGQFTLEVRKGESLLGRETLLVKTEQCRALSLDDGAKKTEAP